MSETVQYKGKLREIRRKDDETLQQLAEHILIETKKTPIPDYYNGDFLECLLEEGYYDYVKINNKLYTVDKEQFDDHDDIFIASKNEDESIDFHLKFYNGGCSFSEAINEAITNMDKDGK